MLYIKPRSSITNIHLIFFSCQNGLKNNSIILINDFFQNNSLTYLRKQIKKHFIEIFTILISGIDVNVWNQYSLDEQCYLSVAKNPKPLQLQLKRNMSHFTTH